MKVYQPLETGANMCFCNSLLWDKEVFLLQNWGIRHLHLFTKGYQYVGPIHRLTEYTRVSNTTLKIPFSTNHSVICNTYQLPCPQMAPPSVFAKLSTFSWALNTEVATVFLLYHPPHRIS